MGKHKAHGSPLSLLKAVTKWFVYFPKFSQDMQRDKDRLIMTEFPSWMDRVGPELRWWRPCERTRPLIYDHSTNFTKPPFPDQPSAAVSPSAVKITKYSSIRPSLTFITERSRPVVEWACALLPLTCVWLLEWMWEIGIKKLQVTEPMLAGIPPQVRGKLCLPLAEHLTPSGMSQHHDSGINLTICNRSRTY